MPTPCHHSIFRMNHKRKVMFRRVKILIGYFVNFARRTFNSCQSEFQLSKITVKGNNCHINGPGYFSYNNIELGNGVHIGANSTFMASESKIIIKDNVVFGPHVFIIGGNHRFDVVGTPIKYISKKRPQDDADVIIDEDCWIGADSIILKGVHIGRGCVIGAGTIVTKSIPPYNIITNKGSRPRFTPEQIREHENKIYGE